MIKITAKIEIGPNKVIALDENNLLDFEYKIMGRKDLTKPSYGIVSNTGSMSFIDIDSKFFEHINNNNDIRNNAVVYGYVVDTDKDVQTQIAECKIENVDYNLDQSLCRLSLKDDLEEWQNIIVPALTYIPNVSTPMYAKDIYEYLYSKTPSKYKMLTYSELNWREQDLLEIIKIQYPYLESASLWSDWEKLCNCCFFNIYKRGDGRTNVIRYAIGYDGTN